MPSLHQLREVKELISDSSPRRGARAGMADIFACCLEESLSKIDELYDVAQLYDTTKHCNLVNLNATDFVSEVISFYMNQVCRKLLFFSHFCSGYRVFNVRIKFIRRLKISQKYITFF